MLCVAVLLSVQDTYVEDLLAAVIKGTLSRSSVPAASLGDIVVGSVLGSNVQRANEVRMGAFLAGVPASVPIHTVNRQCSSGLQAVAHVAAGIRSGYYDIGLACGLESMSSAEFKFTGSTNPRVFMNEQAKACMLPMGLTSENVAKQFGVDRKTQDEFALRSHTLAAAAIREGRFKDEIIPVTTKVKDDKTGQGDELPQSYSRCATSTQHTISCVDTAPLTCCCCTSVLRVCCLSEREVVADVDDGVRADTTFAGLSKLPPAFQPGGSTTAGNSSQVSDGAAAVLLTSRRYARQHSLSVMAVFRSFAVAGVPPEVMGIGPAFAIPMALKQAKLAIADIDLFELNEAFASQATYCVKALGIDVNKVNVNGGAIAIGHPLGATGARATATLLHEMKRRGSRYGIVSMCIGSGMGAAAVYEMEH